MRIANFLFLIFILSGCNNLIEDVVEKYDTGQLKTIKYYKGDKTENSLVKEIQYYPNGKKAYVKTFKNKQPHGEWMFWHSNGKLWSQGEYKMGLRVGLSEVYHKNGQLFFSGLYKNGKKHGTWIFYNENGELENKQEFDMGKALSSENTQNSKEK